MCSASSLTRFIPEHIYNLGSQPIDMEALKGRDCYGGLDLSSTGDITAFVLMFPPRTSEEKYIMLPFFWIPEDTIPQRVRRASVPYDVWYQQGYLMATEGNVIHYGFIQAVFISNQPSQMQISRRSRMKPPLPRQKRISRWRSPMQRRKPRRLPLPQMHRQRQTANWRKACPIR